MRYLGINFNEPFSIMCNNTSAINISKNLVMHSRTKNIVIQYQFLKEKVV